MSFIVSIQGLFLYEKKYNEEESDEIINQGENR